MEIRQFMEIKEFNRLLMEAETKKAKTIEILSLKNQEGDKFVVIFLISKKIENKQFIIHTIV